MYGGGARRTAHLNLAAILRSKRILLPATISKLRHVVVLQMSSPQPSFMLFLVAPRCTQRVFAVI